MENNEKEGLDDNSKSEIPAGVMGISIVLVFSGVWYIGNGVSWLFELFDPIALLLSFYYLGGGILMMIVGRRLVRLELWALWGAIALFAATILLILLNPFASFQYWDNPIGRATGAVAFFLLICYLGMPAVRSKFSHPPFTSTLDSGNELQPGTGF
ncbi:MAG: hypothetical protein ACFFCP_16255 [Promethearchaeota archaeon]